jgi:DNA-binding PadR family transcriptional regulator
MPTKTPDEGSSPAGPLPDVVFHILVALADNERHGYSVMQEVAALTDGRVRLSPGTLYGAIQRMLEQGLIEEVRGAKPAADERRRFYRITAEGRRVAVAETERLRRLLAQARIAGFAPKRT